MLNEISAEDNRYEFKEWDEEWKNLKDDLEKLIAKEICALANSFGGTLFLGVQDKTKEILGIPKFGKGRADSRSWIERLIPNLLEFRLPDFRVLEVDLSPETKSKIGSDKTVLSIDVYDSDLAPHRSKKDDTYYFRQNSQSDPAPHHYLAYLWGRSSPNMSYVVNKWFRDYLNILINTIERSADSFGRNSFNSQDAQTEGFYVRRIVFFHLPTWLNLNANLTAKQFLRTFPDIKRKLGTFEVLVAEFFEGVQKLEDAIMDSEELSREFENFQTTAFFKEEFGEADTSDALEKMAHELHNSPRREEFENLLTYLKDFKRGLAQNTMYLLMDLETSWKPYKSMVFELAKKYIINRFDSPENTIVNEVESISRLRMKVAEMASVLAKEIDELRHALALKHNTTYE